MSFGKVAICISGLSRTGINANVCFKNFFGHLNADVFYHTWQTDQETTVELKQLYQPVTSIEQTPLTSEQTGSFGSMFYSIMMANELKKKYEIENNFRYDLVIKTRFDLVFPIGNRFPTIDIMPRTIYCSGGSPNGINYTDYENHGISDVIFWGDSQSMDIATDCYMYYRHVCLEANNRFRQGHKFDPSDYYHSPGNLIYQRCIKQNIAFERFVLGIREIPWRTDIANLDPIQDYDKIRERYQRV
jgi:hypothetical protein